MFEKLKYRLSKFIGYSSDEVIKKALDAHLFDELRLRLTDHCLHSSEKGITDKEYFAGSKVVVSLTTYGKRLYEVYLSIESIMEQTMRPNKIVLWLSDELKGKPLPMTLQGQMKRGLEIRYCKDIRSYTNLIYSLKAFPDDFIITIDDDIIYHFDLVENLVNSYLNDPAHVYCNRMRKVKLSSDQALLPYQNWNLVISDDDASFYNFLTGVGGVLYFPHCFTSEVFNEKMFMSLCPYGDDIWFYAMLVLNGVKCKGIPQGLHKGFYYDNENAQDIGLVNNNVWGNRNDVQLKAVFDHYDLYKALIEEKN